jgi:hypothetical protein
MALLGWRAWRAGARRAIWAGEAVGAACLGLPLAVYGALNAGPWNRPVLPNNLTGHSSGAAAGAEAVRRTSGFAVYLWEYLLPRVGHMTDFFHTAWAPKDLWVPIWVGRFGWSDYQFPNVVNRFALIVYAVIAVAALVGLIRLVRARAGVTEIAAVSALLALGLIVGIARAGYPLRASGNFIFEQGRYYMPLLCVFALTLALAATLPRRRTAHALAVAFVVLSVVHLGGAMALTVQRYYTFSNYIEQDRAIADTR